MSLSKPITRVALFGILPLQLIAGCQPVERPYGSPDQSTDGQEQGGYAGDDSLATDVDDERSVETQPLRPREEGASTAVALGDASATEGPDAGVSNAEGTQQAANDAGSPNETANDSCAGCTIGSECLASGTSNPDNQCQICNPELSADGWSNVADGNCDDGAFCTVDDACVDGECVGSPRQCEDGVECNGVSECDEEADECSPDVNQCGSLAVCDTESGQCESTCDGCTVGGVCVPAGATRAGNVCLVCDPTRALDDYSPLPGAPCGAAATECSDQDTCDAQAQCQPNHRPPGTPCGSPPSGACDAQDACNGAGFCQTQQAPNGSPCDDGLFCTVGDQCQGGGCQSGGARVCAGVATCNESANQCVCNGCSVGGNCIAPGAPCGASSPVVGGICQVSGACVPDGAADGERCGSDEDCYESGLCNEFYVDGDRDGVGAGTGVSFCGTSPPPGFSRTGDDCLDSNADVFPGQTRFFLEPAPGLEPPFDYNCDGRAVDQLGGRTGQGQNAGCPRNFPDDCFGQVWGTDAVCGNESAVFTCRIQSNGECDADRDGTGTAIFAPVMVQCQ